MSLCLKTYSKREHPSSIELTLEHRLPHLLNPPIKMYCSFVVTSVADYYLLALTMTGTLSIICQRCLEPVNYPYHHSIEIALCRSEARADALMSIYDAIVVENDLLDLEAVVVDELHLSLPQLPHAVDQCSVSL